MYKSVFDGILNLNNVIQPSSKSLSAPAILVQHHQQQTHHTNSHQGPRRGVQLQRGAKMQESSRKEVPHKKGDHDNHHHHEFWQSTDAMLLMVSSAV